MCAPPATSTDPGNFVSPGSLHAVRVTGLEPGAEYAYRAGLGFGQGVKWAPEYAAFRTAPAIGAEGEEGAPAATFLAFADQGCAESRYARALSSGAGGTAAAAHPARDVTALVAHLVANFQY